MISGLALVHDALTEVGEPNASPARLALQKIDRYIATRHSLNTARRNANCSEVIRRLEAQERHDAQMLVAASMDLEDALNELEEKSSMTAGTSVARQTEQRQMMLSTVERYSEEIAKLAPKHVEPAHYVASLRLYLAQNPKLLDCDPGSVARGILRIAQTGLELGVSCDLLPFKKECQFNPRYNGIIELALLSGVRSIEADVVRERDQFEHEKGTQFKLRHHRVRDGGKIIAAYAIAELKPQSFVFDVMYREEIDELRSQYSKSWWNAVEWVNNQRTERRIELDEIPWYAKKTVVRRLAPKLPKNARLAAALMYADETDKSQESAEFDFKGTPDNSQEPAPPQLQEGAQEEAVAV